MSHTFSRVSLVLDSPIGPILMALMGLSLVTTAAAGFSTGFHLWELPPVVQVGITLGIVLNALFWLPRAKDDDPHDALTGLLPVTLAFAPLLLLCACCSEPTVIGPPPRIPLIIAAVITAVPAIVWLVLGASVLLVRLSADPALADTPD